MQLTIECPNYSLKNSFSPSFISSLYEELTPNIWIKIAGHLGGKLKIEQRKKTLIVTTTAEIAKNELEQLMILETGLWCQDFEREVGSLPSRVRGAVEALADRYPGVRLPIAPRDFNYLLITTLLSKRANYNIVRRWCKKIWRIFDGDLDKMASRGCLEKLRRISSSYQLADASKSLRDLLRILKKPEKVRKEITSRFGSPRKPISEYILGLPPEVARMVLLSAWGMGPKVVDSLILSTFKAPDFIPCDTHLKRLAIKLVLVNDFVMPEKSFCKKFVCSPESTWGLKPCPNSQCLRANLRFLGSLGGWIQTLVYLHGREYCRPIEPKCGECPIKDFCTKNVIS